MIYGIFKTHLTAEKLKLYLYMIVSYMLNLKGLGTLIPL